MGGENPEMEDPPGPVVVECLACGAERSVPGLGLGEIGECPACGYTGWALPERLTDSERRRLHSALLSTRRTRPKR